jgi:UDP-apiose/xylose synthase
VWDQFIRVLIDLEKSLQQLGPHSFGSVCDLVQDPAYYILKEDESPCIFGPIEKQRWSYACAKQLIERLIYGMYGQTRHPNVESHYLLFIILCFSSLYAIHLLQITSLLSDWNPFFVFAAEGAENDLEFTIVRPFNWIGPRMDFIPGIDGPSESVPRVLACFSNNLMRGEPLKLVDGGQSQRTFVYIKDAIEAVLRMIENPARANGHIFNVGNPHNELTVRELAELMTDVYCKVSGNPRPAVPTIDVTSMEFYGQGYDDSDKRIPDMTIIKKQLEWEPKTPVYDLMESTLTYQHTTYAQAVKKAMSKTLAN